MTEPESELQASDVPSEPGPTDTPAESPQAPLADAPAGPLAETPDDTEAEEEIEAGGPGDGSAEVQLAAEQLALAESIEACRDAGLLPMPRVLFELTYGEPEDGLQWCPSCRGGAVVPTSLNPHPQTQTCATCRGLGEVSTGSQVLVNSKAECPTCSGLGYTGTATPAAFAPSAPAEDRPLVSPLVAVGE